MRIENSKLKALELIIKLLEKFNFQSYDLSKQESYAHFYQNFSKNVKFLEFCERMENLENICRHVEINSTSCLFVFLSSHFFYFISHNTFNFSNKFFIISVFDFNSFFLF